jgi:hypothetical protein
VGTKNKLTSAAVSFCVCGCKTHVGHSMGVVVGRRSNGYPRLLSNKTTCQRRWKEHGEEIRAKWPEVKEERRRMEAEQAEVRVHCGPHQSDNGRFLADWLAGHFAKFPKGEGGRIICPMGDQKNVFDALMVHHRDWLNNGTMPQGAFHYHYYKAKNQLEGGPRTRRVVEAGVAAPESRPEIAPPPLVARVVTPPAVVQDQGGATGRPLDHVPVVSGTRRPLSPVTTQPLDVACTLHLCDVIAAELKMLAQRGDTKIVKTVYEMIRPLI